MVSSSCSVAVRAVPVVSDRPAPRREQERDGQGQTGPGRGSHLAALPDHDSYSTAPGSLGSVTSLLDGGWESFWVCWITSGEAAAGGGRFVLGRGGTGRRCGAPGAAAGIAHELHFAVGLRRR